MTVVQPEAKYCHLFHSLMSPVLNSVRLSGCGFTQVNLWVMVAYEILTFSV